MVYQESENGIISSVQNFEKRRLPLHNIPATEIEF